ncbi:MAG: heavy metal translocating P-type ATPase [Burkholderiales bacterium]|nr:heavy metal translocating P-type ATPase [Burkholderiales bacterium]
MGATSLNELARGEYQACFHCGQSVPVAAHFPVSYVGAIQPTCCRGCQAVASAIIDQGFGDYYRHRSALPANPEAALPEFLAQVSLYDTPEIQRSFVRVEAGNVREAALLLEGIRCAACVWLNEQHLASLPGVLSVDINYTTRRARVRWDDSQIHLSDILRAVAAIGYTAHPFDATRQEDVQRRERRIALRRLAIAGLSMMQVMMYAIPAYLDDGSMSADIQSLMRWASLLLTLPVVLYSSAPFFLGAWRDVSSKRVGMDVPVALGILVAFSASCYATLAMHGEVYFDSIAMFVFLLLGGRYLEMGARERAAQAADRLAKLIPAIAVRFVDFALNRNTEDIAVAQLASGDHVLIRPGAAIPADGVVVEGQSEADESLLTGESRAIDKRAGDALVGGAINISGPLVMRVTHIGQDTVLAGMLRLLDRAQSEKPQLALLADRAAQIFVAVILVIAALAALVWYVIDPSKAIFIAVSVLVVTCPCALSLATPAALTAATGALTRIGLLVTRGHALETLARVTDVIFDKTGTLTLGRTVLRQTQTLSDAPAVHCLQLANALEQGSEHSLAQALRQAGPSQLVAADVRNTPGSGIEGVIEGMRLRIGSLAFVAELAGTLPGKLRPHDAAHTLIGLGSAQGWLALFEIGDSLRAEAAQLVSALQARGLRVHLLSGDSEGAVNAVARQLGIEQVQAQAKPEDKVRYVQALQAQGAVVAMVGDGVNDAPVLAQAQVSIAMGGGASVAHAAADVVMLSGSLLRIDEALDKAAATRRIVRQNLLWALVYNLIAIPPALLGFVTPWMAGIGMSLSSLIVVVNALRLADHEKPAAIASIAPRVLAAESV